VRPERALLKGGVSVDLTFYSCAIAAILVPLIIIVVVAFISVRLEYRREKERFLEALEEDHRNRRRIIRDADEREIR
jgi:uncharacterized membrane protein YhiD involved in acid resistance